MTDDTVRWVPTWVVMPPRSMPCGCDRRSKGKGLASMVAVGEQFFIVCHRCEAAVEIPPENVLPLRRCR